MISISWSVHNFPISLHSLSAHFALSRGILTFSFIYFSLPWNWKPSILALQMAGSYILFRSQPKMSLSRKSPPIHPIYCSSLCCHWRKHFSCRLYLNQHTLFAQLFTCSLLWKVCFLRIGGCQLCWLLQPQNHCYQIRVMCHNFTRKWVKETRGYCILFQFVPNKFVNWGHLKYNIILKT